MPQTSPKSLFHIDLITLLHEVFVCCTCLVHFSALSKKQSHIPKTPPQNFQACSKNVPEHPPSIPNTSRTRPKNIQSAWTFFFGTFYSMKSLASELFRKCGGDFWRCLRLFRSGFGAGFWKENYPEEDQKNQQILLLGGIRIRKFVWKLRGPLS